MKKKFRKMGVESSDDFEDMSDSSESVHEWGKPFAFSVDVRLKIKR